MNADDIIDQVREILKGAMLRAYTDSIGCQIEQVNKALRGALAPYVEDVVVSSQFASKKDAVWGGKVWSIPYVTEDVLTYDHENDAEYIVSTQPTWRSRRQIAKYLKSKRGVVYSSFTIRPASTVKSVQIRGVVKNDS